MDKMKLKNYEIFVAKGYILTTFARLHGLDRRWFGFEPDWLLRIRLKRFIRIRYNLPKRFWYV